MRRLALLLPVVAMAACSGGGGSSPTRDTVAEIDTNETLALMVGHARQVESLLAAEGGPEAPAVAAGCEEGRRQVMDYSAPLSEEATGRARRQVTDAMLVLQYAYTTCTPDSLPQLQAGREALETALADNGG